MSAHKNGVIKIKKNLLIYVPGQEAREIETTRKGRTQHLSGRQSSRMRTSNSDMSAK